MAERRHQLEELFHAALARKPDERASFLSEACSSDPSLRAEVESLISAHEQPGSFLESPAYEVAASLIADAEDESIVGRSMGHYDVVAFIGKGGMGYVYLARDTRLDRKVALKLLPPKFTEDEIRLRRFVMEARAASSLNHPNIITIHEIGQAGSVHFIATEFIEGQTLRHLLTRGRLKLGDALDIAIQTASALAAAHAAGIMHRDIKPENIMLRPDGYVKVLDFGLAKLAEVPTQPLDTNSPTAPKVDTDPGIIMGTANYMSPEQTRGQSVDGRSDVFNLGVVVYEMIAGRQPFEGETTADVIASILKTEPPPLAEFAPDAPAELQRIANRALSKDREQRYQTSEEMLADLKAVRHELEFALKRDESTTVVPDTASRVLAFLERVFTRRLALPILVAAILVGALWPLPRSRPGVQPDADWLSDLQLVHLADWKSELGESQIGCRFSPDGKMFAYYATRDGHLAIVIKQTDRGNPVQLTKDEWDYWSPVWSPDGQQIAVASNRGK